MKACVKSFYLAVMGDGQSESLVSFVNESYHVCEGRKLEKRSGETCQRILLFNSMSVRDLHLIFTHRRNTCAKYGVDFKKALLFVPNMSMSHTVGMNALLENNDEASVDLSWQYTLQEVWECLVGKGDGGKNGENSEVFSSLPLAIKLRDSVVDQNSSSTRLQVLVTGSLQLMGDVLRLVTKWGNNEIFSSDSCIFSVSKCAKNTLHCNLKKKKGLEKSVKRTKTYCNKFLVWKRIDIEKSLCFDSCPCEAR